MSQNQMSDSSSNRIFSRSLDYDFTVNTHYRNIKTLTYYGCNEN